MDKYVFSIASNQAYNFYVFSWEKIYDLFYSSDFITVNISFVFW